VRLGGVAGLLGLQLEHGATLIVVAAERGHDDGLLRQSLVPLHNVHHLHLTQRRRRARLTPVALSHAPRPTACRGQQRRRGAEHGTVAGVIAPGPAMAVAAQAHAWRRRAAVASVTA